MKLTEEEIFDIVKDLKPSKWEYPSSKTLSSKIAEILNVKSSAELKNIVADQFWAYKRDQKHLHRRIALNAADFDQNGIIPNCFAMAFIYFFWMAFHESPKPIFPGLRSA